MLQITTTFNALYLSADLPDEVVFTVDLPSFTVIVFQDHAIRFQTTLYPYNNKATLHDLRSIIEDALRLKDNIRPTFEVSISDGTTYVSSGEFEVVYSEIIPNYNAIDFCKGRFLTTRTSFRISRSGTQRLSWFCRAGETYSAYTECVVRPRYGGAMKVVTVNEAVQRTASWASSVDKFEFPVDFYQDYLDGNYPDEYLELIAFTIHRGNRVMNFYITDEQPDVIFKFYNAFDCLEYAELFAVTTAKQKIERSEAICQRNHLFYDQKNEQTFEVETALLSYEEAVWLNQMLSSRKVMQADYHWQGVEVLITESTSEISDSDDAKNRIKFTWKWAKEVQMKRIYYKGMNFTTEFNQS